MSFVSKIVKVQSSTTPPFSVSRNNVKLELQTDGVVDMQKSYLVFNTTLSGTDDGGVHKLYLGDATYNFKSSCFIRTATLSSSVKGTLEEVHQANILDHNLSLVKRGYGRQFNHGTPFGVGIEIDDEFVGIYRSAFQTLGLTSSDNRAVDLQLPLRDLFGLGWSSNLDVSKFGKLTMSLELENVLPLVYENLSYVPADELDLDDQPITPVVALETLATTFENDGSLSLWSGCYVEVSYTGGDGNSPKKTLVTSVSKTAANKMKITLADSLGGVAVTAVSLVQVPMANLTYTINDVQCVLYQKSGTAEDVDLVYNRWLCERVSKSPTTNFQRNFDIEPNCSTVILMTPLANKLTSQADSCSSYRMQINGIDTTDQSIVPHEDLYMDRVFMTFENAGMPANSTLPSNTIFCNPMPLVPKNQGLHIDMAHTAPSASPVSYLYKLIEQEV